MIILDGKKIRDEILAEVKTEVASLSFQPVFCDIMIGLDLVSQQYVKMKAKATESVGIRFHYAPLPADINLEYVLKETEILNKMPNMCGIIVQLPLPKSLETRIVLDSIDPSLDVDCLGTIASEEFYQGRSQLGSPAALACMALLDSTGLDLKNKKIVVLGQGDLVGKPVTALLQARGLNPETITRSTHNRDELIKEADVIISGIGQGKFITGDMIKEGVVLIDAGTSESNSSIVGDVDSESVNGIAGYLSPVPGGVGPVTVAMLIKNVLTVAKSKRI